MKLSIRSAGASIALAFLAFSVAQASAVTIYDNLSQTSGGSAEVSSQDHGPLYDSFSTGAQAVNLTDVKLLLQASTPGDGGSFLVGLYADNSTSPGSALATSALTPDSVLQANLAVIDFPFLQALAANTRYWIGVSATNSSAQWSYDMTNGGIGVANEYNFYDGSVSANNAFTPYQMQVNVKAATPEPASWPLVLLFGAGFVLIRRR